MNKDLYITMSTMPKRLLPISLGLLSLLFVVLLILFYVPLVPEHYDIQMENSSLSVDDNYTINLGENNIRSYHSIKDIQLMNKNDNLSQTLPFRLMNDSDIIQLELPSDSDFEKGNNYFIRIALQKSLLSYLIYK